MVSPKRNKHNTAFIVFLIIISLLNLLFLYYSKYNNHGLSLGEFTFSIGNFLNLFFTAVLIAGLIIASGRRTKVKGAGFYVIMTSVFLMLTVILKLVDIPFPQYFLFNHPFADILMVLLYVLFQLCQFTAISVVFSRLRDRDRFLHLKAAGNSLFIIVLLLAFSYFFSRKDVNTPVTRSEIQNIGVVLGAAVWSHDKPSPTLISRLDKAVELYQRGYLQKVQLTGSNAPGELTEAEVAFKYIMNKGIAPEDIFYEEKTTSTAEQVKFIKERLLPLSDKYNVVIISDNYHLPRISEITKFYNVRADLAGSTLNLNEKDSLYYNLRESIGLVVFWLFAL